MSYQRRDFDRRSDRRQASRPASAFNNWPEPEREHASGSQHKPRGKPPSQRKRDQRRQDTFRENHPKTKEAEKRIEDLINKKLFFGFDDALTAEKAVDFSLQQTAAVVPVTTRAVGFYTQWIFKKVYELYGRRPDRIPRCSPYAFYRVTLAQFEFKLLSVKSGQINTLNYNAGDFYRPTMVIENRDTIKTCPVNFTVLVNLLAGVGNFEYEGECYYVKCPNDDVLGILLSNLRRVVERMSNPATQQAERQAFYDLNPLPFSRWNQPQRAGVRRRADGQVPVDPGFPLLLNPNEIMPAEYGEDDLAHDVHEFKNFISYVSRKEVKMIAEGCSIDYEGRLEVSRKGISD